MLLLCDFTREISNLVQAVWNCKPYNYVVGSWWRAFSSSISFDISRLGVATADICICITWNLFYGRIPFLPPTLFSEGKWATCLPHKGGGVPLSALPKDTTRELAGLLSTLFLLYWAPIKEAVNIILKSRLVWLDKGNEPQVYRLRSGRSNHYTIAPDRELLVPNKLSAHLIVM